jgi:predicted nucleotidyltransferase
MVDILGVELSDSVTKYLNEVSKLVNIDKAYLYGSYSTKEITEDSDIDIAIISDDFSGDQFKDNVLLNKLTWGIDTRIEAVAFRVDSIKNSMLGNEILQTGVELKIN